MVGARPADVDVVGAAAGAPVPLAVGAAVEELPEVVADSDGAAGW